MRNRWIVSVVTAVLGLGAVNAQVSIYPFPPEQPQQVQPVQRPAFAPKPAPLPPPPPLLPPPADPINVAPAAATQAPPDNRWYPNPSPYPLQQTRADGAMPLPPAPRPQPVPPLPMGQDCPNPNAPYMQDVNQACETCSTDCLCGPPGRIWFGAEYLRWTTKGNPLPPLLTTAPVGTPRAVAGTIGNPSTTVLLGGNNANNNWRNGLRFYGGIWLNDDNTCGLDLRYFYLGQSDYSATVGSNGSQILTRPFTNNVIADPLGNFSAVAPFADTELVSFPGTIAGSTTVESQTQLHGFDPNIIHNLNCPPCARLDGLLGYRYMYLYDSLTIQENLTGLAGSGFSGANFIVTDSFQTKNYFHGVNAGFNYERRFDQFYFGMRTTLAMGVNHSVVNIDGSTRITTAAGAATTYPGGLLALPSNMGTHSSDSFSVIPEVGMKIGMQVTEHLRIFTGYNYLYWSNVTRTGGVIDTRVNASQRPPPGGLVGAVYPQYDPTRTGFYAHGFTAGLELRY